MQTRSKRSGKAGARGGVAKKGATKSGSAAQGKASRGVKVVVSKTVKVVPRAGSRRGRSDATEAAGDAGAPAALPTRARRKTSLSASAGAGSSISMGSLDTNTLNEIFTRVGSQAFCREVLPLVCKRFRDALVEPSLVWESIHLDFLAKDIDLDLAQAGPAAAAPDAGRNRRLMRTAVERWLAPRASGVKRLVVSFSEKEPTHSFPKSGRGLSKLLGMLAPGLQQLHVAACSDIFRGPSFADLAQMKHLETLAVTFNTARLSSADLAPLEQCRALRSLTIACSTSAEEGGAPCFAAFPDSLLKLRGLTALAFSSRGVTAVPATITRLKDLACLDLSSCSLTALPPSLSKLSGLHRLALNGTRVSMGLASAWQPLARLPALRELELRDTEMYMLPAMAGQPQLSALTSLDLGCNQIDPVSFGFGDVLAGLKQTPRLRRLVLRRNQLGALPDCIFDLTQLTHLDVSHNQLVDLPATMEALSQLRELSAEGNSFPRIPQVLHKLPSLERADLSFCIYLEASLSLAAMAEEGFPVLQCLDLRKMVGLWKPSSRQWLRGLAAALEAHGRPRGCVLWDEELAAPA